MVEIIYIPKKVLVKKDAVYKKIVHGQDLISRAKPGKFASLLYFQAIFNTSKSKQYSSFEFVDL